MELKKIDYPLPAWDLERCIHSTTEHILQAQQGHRNEKDREDPFSLMLPFQRAFQSLFLELKETLGAP